MTRFATLFWIALVLASGFATYRVKYAVQDLEDQLHRARKQTVVEQQEIRVLAAEWTYLNQPERLADLNHRFLGLLPITAKQLQARIDSIPMRAPAPPPDVLIAANKPVATLPPPVPHASIAAALIPSASRPVPAVHLAKAGAAGSLDSLFARVAEKP